MKASELLEQLLIDLQEMRENGDFDIRTIIHTVNQILNETYKIENGKKD